MIVVITNYIGENKVGIYYAFWFSSLLLITLLLCFFLCLGNYYVFLGFYLLYFESTKTIFVALV